MSQKFQILNVKKTVQIGLCLILFVICLIKVLQAISSSYSRGLEVKQSVGASQEDPKDMITAAVDRSKDSTSINKNLITSDAKLNILTDFYQEEETYDELSRKAILSPTEKQELAKILRNQKLIDAAFEYLSSADMKLDQTGLQARIGVFSFLVKSASYPLGVKHKEFIEEKIKNYIIETPVSQIKGDKEKLKYFFGDRIAMLLYLNKGSRSSYDKIKGELKGLKQTDKMFQLSERAIRQYRVGI